MLTQSESPLFHKIASILNSNSRDDRAVVDAVDALAVLHGDDVYDEFFYVLTRKRLGAATAAQHWNMVFQHIDSLITPHYRTQGFLPSLLHYMQYQQDVIGAPRFIESAYIDNILRSSVTDGLTGLYNQTFFKNCLVKLIHQTQRSALPSFSIVMFDLDHFKEFNDRAGHLAGDHALQRTAAIIRENLRESDIAARYGGEEFALLLPQTARIMARKVAQRIRIAIEQELFAGQELLSSGNLTISGGIAEYPCDAESAGKLIESADAELYKSKIRRNSVYPNEDDRRRNIRRPVQSLVEFLPGEGGHFRPGLSFDISEFGISLGCDQPFPLDSKVSLRFTPPYWRCSCVQNGTVRQCRKVDDLCVLGLEFDQVFDMVNAGPHSCLDRNAYRNGRTN